MSPMDSYNEGSFSYSKLMSQEGVYQLTKDLRTFSEALTALKAVFLDERSKVVWKSCLQQLQYFSDRMSALTTNFD